MNTHEALAGALRGLSDPALQALDDDASYPASDLIIAVHQRRNRSHHCSRTAGSQIQVGDRVGVGVEPCVPNW